MLHARNFKVAFDLKPKVTCYYQSFMAVPSVVEVKYSRSC